MCVWSHFSCVQLWATLWTVACQAPLWTSLGKNTGVDCHALPSRRSSRPRDRTHMSCLLHWQAGFCFCFCFCFFFKPLEPPGKPQFSVIFPCHCIGDVMLWGCEGPGSILEFCVLMIRFQVYYGSRDFGLCSSQMFPSSLCEAGRLEGVGIGYFLSP